MSSSSSQSSTSAASCAVARLSHTGSSSYLLAKWSFVLVLIMCATTWRNTNQAEASNAKVRLCGAKLVKMVTAICKGCVQGSKLETGSHTKRNLLSASDRAKAFELAISPKVEENRSWSEESHDDESNPEHPIIRQTRKGGIATECCEQMCTFGFLKSFCCNPS